MLKFSVLLLVSCGLLPPRLTSNLGYPAVSLFSSIISFTATLVVAICCVTTTLRADDNLEAVASLLELVIDVDADAAKKCLATVSSKIQSGEVSAEQQKVLRQRLDPCWRNCLHNQKHPLRLEAAFVLASSKHEVATKLLRTIAGDDKLTAETRLRAFDALLLGQDGEVLVGVETVLASTTPATRMFREQLLASLGRSHDPRIAEVVLKHYAKLEPELQPKAIELLTQRPVWSAALVAEVEQKKLSSAVLNASQLLKLQASADDNLRKS